MIMELSSVFFCLQSFSTYVLQFYVRKHNINTYVENSDLTNISMSSHIIDKNSILKGRRKFLNAENG